MHLMARIQPGLKLGTKNPMQGSHMDARSQSLEPSSLTPRACFGSVPTSVMEFSCSVSFFCFFVLFCF